MQHEEGRRQNKRTRDRKAERTTDPRTGNYHSNRNHAKYKIKEGRPEKEVDLVREAITPEMMPSG